MAEVEAFVWHDLDGNITAVGHVVPGHLKRVDPLVRPGQNVLTLRLDEQRLAQLHLTHVVDVSKGGVYRRASDSSSEARSAS